MISKSAALETAVRHYQAGQLTDAQRICTQIIAAEPAHAAAWGLLGAIACHTADYDRAIECFSRPVALTPGDAAAHYNLGNALRLQGNLNGSIDCYERALQLQPNFAEAQNNLGVARQDQGDLDQAAGSFRRALEINPNFVAAHNNLGNALKDQGRLDEAIQCFHLALQLDPHSADVHNNLGAALKDRGELPEAIEHHRRAIALQPDFAIAWSNLLYALNFCEDLDAAAIFEEHSRFSEQLAEPLAKFVKPHSNDRDPNRRLRIGYVSPDFRHHCQSFFTLPLFAAHGHQQFEIFCYSDVARPDSVTQRLQSHADAWRNIQGASDEHVANIVRQDQIDILVDLTMHMAGGRPLLFARKPAPLQICWLAYPGTTGLSAIDYRLTDPFLDPPHKPEAQARGPAASNPSTSFPAAIGATSPLDHFYSERSIRLPETFWCYDPLGLEPPVNSLPALNSGYITFGSLNNFCKVNRTVLGLWANVLRAVNNSRLMLLAPGGLARQRTLDIFAQEKISADRITFIARQPLQQYLSLYNSIDISLDTLPANGHTTSLDSFWMGVPVITLLGLTAVGRGGLSQLTNLGLAELVAYSPDEFVVTASKLAADLPRLAALRASLRDQMRCSPLMNAPAFARNLEATYRRLWQQWCSH